MKHFAYASYDEKMKNESFRLQCIPFSVIRDQCHSGKQYIRWLVAVKFVMMGSFRKAAPVEIIYGSIS